MPDELTIYILAVVGLLCGLGIPRPPLRREKPEPRLYVVPAVTEAEST